MDMPPYTNQNHYFGFYVPLTQKNYCQMSGFVV